jgi:AcrR family transcriptional regulator
LEAGKPTARAVSMNPRKSTSQVRSQATVEALLDATARILLREGYDRTSTNRLAAVAGAGAGAGSLYRYFPNKESLVAALVARHNRQIFALLSDAMAAMASLDLEYALRELVGAMVDAHRVDPELHRIFDKQVPRMGQLAEIEAINFVDDVTRLLAGYLRPAPVTV